MCPPQLHKEGTRCLAPTPAPTPRYDLLFDLRLGKEKVSDFTAPRAVAKAAPPSSRSEAVRSAVAAALRVQRSAVALQHVVAGRRVPFTAWNRRNVVLRVAVGEATTAGAVNALVRLRDHMFTVLLLEQLQRRGIWLQQSQLSVAGIATNSRLLPHLPADVAAQVANQVHESESPKAKVKSRPAVVADVAEEAKTKVAVGLTTSRGETGAVASEEQKESEWRRDETRIGEQVPESAAKEDWQIADVVVLVGLLLSMNACAYTLYKSRARDEFTATVAPTAYGDDDDDDWQKEERAALTAAESRQRRQLYTSTI